MRKVDDGEKKIGATNAIISQPADHRLTVTPTAHVKSCLGRKLSEAKVEMSTSLEVLKSPAHSKQVYLICYVVFV